MVNEAAVAVVKADGFNSGLNWPDAWMSHGKPGGPWVPSRGYNSDPKWAETCNQLAAERVAWCQGWEEGLAEKIATGRINPFVGTESNARYHQGREHFSESGGTENAINNS